MDTVKRTTELVEAPKTKGMAVLAFLIVVIVASGLLLTAFHAWHAPSGAFDPRSDEYSTGECP